MASLAKARKFVQESGYRFELKELSRSEDGVKYCVYVSKRDDAFTTFSSFLSTIPSHLIQNAENALWAALEGLSKLYSLIPDAHPNTVFYLQEDMQTYYTYDGYYRYLLGGEFDRYVNQVKDMTKFIMYFGQPIFMELMQ